MLSSLYRGDFFMNFNNDEYLPRLIDKNLDDYLKVFGALSVDYLLKDLNGVEKHGHLLSMQKVLSILMMMKQKKEHYLI